MKILLVISFFGFLFCGNQLWSQCANDANIYSFTYNNTDYEVVKEMKNWSDASACAVERGGYLVEIDDINEQTAVFNGIDDAGVSPIYTNVSNGGGIAYVWIGGTDQESEGTWVWNGDNDNDVIHFWSGQGVNGSGNGSAENNLYNNWGGKSTGTNNEPDDFGQGQDYAAIALEGWPSGTTDLGIAGEWNDIYGSSSLYFVIEKDNTLGTNTYNQPEPKVYPNPTSDRLFVSNTDITGETQFEIYSIAGKTLAKGLFNDNSGINIKRLNQGIYYLKIENQHFTEIIKFVKQ